MDRGPVGARPHVVLEHVLLVLEHTIVCFLCAFCEIRCWGLSKRREEKKKRASVVFSSKIKEAKRTVEVELRRPGVGLALERVLCDDGLSFSSSSAAAVRGVISLLLAAASSVRGRAATAASVEHSGERGLAFGRRCAHGKGRARLHFFCRVENGRGSEREEREKEREREGKREREKERERQRGEKESRAKNTNLDVADKGHAPRRPPRRAASDDHGAVGGNDSRISGVDRGRDEPTQGRPCSTWSLFWRGKEEAEWKEG